MRSNVFRPDPQNNGHTTRLADRVRLALAELWKAFNLAREIGLDAWQFSLPLLHLTERGADETDLRSLVAQGYAEHGEEITTFRHKDRRFRRCPNLAFTSTTCFVLTKAGARFVDGGTEQLYLARPASLSADVVPRWDGQLRVLEYGGWTVKQFRQPAENQELVLAAFQEVDWRDHVDDPLPPRGEIPPKERLHTTITKLNRRQVNKLLEFRGDGTGQGVFWSPFVKSGNKAVTER